MMKFLLGRKRSMNKPTPGLSTNSHRRCVQTRKPIILGQDGARYHTSKALQKFFAAHAHRLTVHQLPAYSPDYNPRKKIKERDIHLHYFPTFDDLKVKVETAL